TEIPRRVHRPNEPRFLLRELLAVVVLPPECLDLSLLLFQQGHQLADDPLGPWGHCVTHLLSPSRKRRRNCLLATARRCSCRRRRNSSQRTASLLDGLRRTTWYRLAWRWIRT